MKTIAILITCLFLFNSCANDSANSSTSATTNQASENNAANGTAKQTKNKLIGLELSEEKRAKLQVIQKEGNAVKKEIKANTELTKAEKQQKLKDTQQTTETKIKALLDDSEYSKYQGIRSNRSSKDDSKKAARKNEKKSERAQKKANKKDGQQNKKRNKDQLSNLTKQLNLNDSQAQQVDAILKEGAAKRKAGMEAIRKTGKKDKEAMKANRQKIKAEIDQKILEVLNEEQATKFKAKLERQAAKGK